MRVIGSASLLAAAALGLGLGGGYWVAAEGCPPIRDGTIHLVATAVSHRRQVLSGKTPSVMTIDRMPGSCVQRITFDGGNGPVFAFLSRDQRYVFSGAVDLLHITPTSAVAKPPLVHQEPPLSAPQGQPLSVAQRMEIVNWNSPPVQGPANAPNVLVEFSDFECPFCRQEEKILKNQIFPQHARDLRFVYRQFPLPVHPWAETAARMSVCAEAQGQQFFWSLSDHLFERQDELTLDNLDGDVRHWLSGQTGFDMARFEVCRTMPETAARVRGDIALGNKFGVNGTPTLFVNGRPLYGVKSAAIIEAAMTAGPKE